jgi:alcohol dehydrogenase
MQEPLVGAKAGQMRALVYHGPGRKGWEEKPLPVLIEPTDAIVRITTTTICGTDLHILKGDLPSVAAGRILGHEGVGIVVGTGASVAGFHPGDRVLISCITSCGTCDMCRKTCYSHCRHGGWILGNEIDGTQAEFVRIPYADTSLYPVPVGSDEEAMVMLSDILPTSFECGVVKGCVSPGDTVAIVGAGPVGLAAVLTSKFYSPNEIIVVDTDAGRLETALGLGATRVVDNSEGRAAKTVMELTGGAGVDVAIEAVGVPATLELCQEIVAVGGHIANIGVHGQPVLLHMERLWDRNITLTTRLVDTSSIPILLKALTLGRLDARKLSRHRFALGDIEKAYGVFQNAAKERALKVVLKGDE